MERKTTEMAEAQRRADTAHHVNRLAWLKSATPAWSCGTPVGAADRQNMINQSQDYLVNPVGQFNHCQCEPRCN